MTTEQTENPPPEKFQLPFAARVLPWIIALGIFLVYFFTLNHWVTLKSLPVVAKVADWDWHPATIAPLYFLLTYPLHWLAGNAQFVGLNLFSAICAALTLALLARSVTLLPQDRTPEQRQRELGKFALLNFPKAWLASVAAVLVCGLQLTFWEAAVVAGGEMLDLLLFAYVVRCLLEFRISQRERWLMKFALVYGLGVANNWAMSGFFPFFLTAFIWTKGRSFFNLRFLLRIIICGAIGLSLYLVLPLINSFSASTSQSIFETLKENLRFQKNYLTIPFVQFTVMRSHLFMIALTSLLPVLMIAIRWPADPGEISPAGTWVAAFMFRLMHLVFLGICLWVFFDPQFSARSLGFEIAPFLTFYYLTALSVGYFVGYVLVVFGRQPEQAWARSWGTFKIIHPIVLVVVWIAALAVPILLARKNLPLIRALNGDALPRYAKTMAESLPARGAVILSDDPLRLFLLRAFVARSSNVSENIFLDTSSLQSPSYHKFLHARHSTDFPPLASKEAVPPGELIFRLDTLAKSHPIFYLHPSFGYYFERFYATPHKLVYQFQIYPTNSLTAPPLSAAVLTENGAYWNSFAKELFPRLSALAKENSEARFINLYYSRALNYWGVESQKAKRLTEAGSAFRQAVALNPENVVAQINQQFNASLIQGEVRAVEQDDELEKKLGQYRDIQTAMNWNGPFDEPNFSLQLGEIFARGGNLRQSAQLFIRVLELVPNSFGARIGLAKTYIELQRADAALQLIAQLRNDSKTLSLNTNAELELLRVESLAYLAKNDFPTAEKILLTASQQKPDDETHLALLTQFYLDIGKYTNALDTVQKQLRVAPANPRALFTKAVLQMNLGQYALAAETLDQLLRLQPSNYNALLNRAIANLQSGKLDDAKRDYEILLEAVPPSTYQIYYGLAQVAEKKNDSRSGIKNYQLYLKYAPAGTPEYLDVQKRLKTLQTKK